MTGYGRGTVSADDFSVSVDLKTVNNRFLDIHLRVGTEWSSLEAIIKRRVSSRLSRGRVDVAVSVERTTQTAYELNRPLIAGYVAALRTSNFTIDHAHPKQSGITIRCFEALGAQTKLITNNRFVTENPLFTQKNTIVFNEATSPGDLLFSVEALRENIPVRQNRTVRDFLDELLA